MKRQGKAEAQRAHAQLRFRERIGFAASPGEIAQRIRNNESLHVWRQSDRVKLHVLDVLGVIQVFVYDTHTHVVVTVLPECDSRVSDMRRKFARRQMKPAS